MLHNVHYCVVISVHKTRFFYVLNHFCLPTYMYIDMHYTSLSVSNLLCGCNTKLKTCIHKIIIIYSCNCSRVVN